MVKKATEVLVEDFERKTPYAQDAEASVLGAMLMDREAIGLAIETLEEECFYVDTHRKLFKAMIALYEKSIEVDPVTLSEQLKKNGTLEEIGGLPFIFELAGSVPTSANVVFHAHIVREKSMLRKLIESCTTIIQEAYQPVEDVDKLVDYAEERIFKIQDFRLKMGPEIVGPLIHNVINELEVRSLSESPMTGIPSGFRDLDELIVGFQKSDLIIIAGRPSAGKTAFCLNVALNLACPTREHPEQVPVAVFSLEMSKQQLVQRLLCSLACVEVNKMRKGELTDLDWHQLNDAANKMFEAPIFVDDTPAISVLELRAKARRLHKTANIGLLIVDYLQLVTTSGRVESRQQEVSYISRSLKALAKELDIPVMALSQLSRAVESRTDQKPRLADLRESGAIEQDSDLVLFIYRPEMTAGFSDKEEQEDRDTSKLAKLLLEKNRNGPTGTVELVFVKEFTQFKDKSFLEELY